MGVVERGYAFTGSVEGINVCRKQRKKKSEKPASVKEQIYIYFFIFANEKAWRQRGTRIVLLRAMTCIFWSGLFILI